MPDILCNTSNPSLVKLSDLMGNKIIGFHDRVTGQGIRMFCRFNGELMRTTEAKALILQQMKDKDITLVNHQGYPIKLRSYNEEVLANRSP